MGSIPTQTFKADLNGTGTLVDITTYVAGSDFEHTWGRSDWTSQVQPQGTLSVTLENLDGRFTPGSTAVYARGIVRNMCIEWTCGARVRRFYVLAAGLAFPDGVAGKPLVALQCVDALALLAGRPMLAMVRETTMKAGAVGLWPLDESSSAEQFSDISGNGQPALYPFTKLSGQSISWGAGSTTDLISPGNGRGPRTDGASALTVNGATTTPLATTSPSIPRGGVRNLLVNDGTLAGARNREIVKPNLSAPIVGASYPLSGWNMLSGGKMQFVLSFWFAIKDIYGSASGTGTDGPYVYLAGVDQGAGKGIHIMWRIADHTLVVSTANGITQLSTSAVTTGDVHHFALAVDSFDWNWNSGAYSGVSAVVRGHLDGAMWSATTVAAGNVAPPIGVLLATPVDYYPTRTGSDVTVYALSGTMSTVSVHGPDSINYTGGSIYWPSAADVWDAGTSGPVEDASARFTRVGGLATRLPATLAYSPQGTPQAGLLGPHDTAGKDALTVLCETLACEEASMDTIVSGGVDTVRAWLDSTQRSLTPALTIDVQDDASETPELGFDLSGVVASATAKSWGQSAAWSDTSAAAQWKGGRADVASAVASPSDLLLLAQYRTAKGRVARVSPTRVVVNAAGSTANLTAALLGLYPGATVRVQTMPSSQVGYSSIDCTVVGCRERHGLGVNTFELTLIPRTPELYADPLLGTEGPWRMVDEPDWVVSPISGVLQGSGWCGQWMGLYGTTTGGALSSGATTGYIVSNKQSPPLDSPLVNTVPTTFFSQDAADFPVYIKVDDEVIYLPNPAGTPTSVTIGSACWYQQITGMVRGQMGTSAAAHGAFTPSSISGDQKLTVVTDVANIPLAAF